MIDTDAPVEEESMIHSSPAEGAHHPMQGEEAPGLVRSRRREGRV